MKRKSVLGAVCLFVFFGLMSGQSFGPGFAVVGGDAPRIDLATAAGAAGVPPLFMP